MLIVFDLDDTLIDTSGSIGPKVLERAFDEMVDAGLPIDSMSEAKKALARLYATSAHGQAGIREFVELMGGSAAVAERGIAAMYGTFGGARAADGAIELLSLLSKDHQLAVVTRGNEETQQQKLEAAGIDAAFFAMFCVTQDFDKGPLYTRLLTELGFSPKSAIVIGDRIEIDLAPAKALGMTTVHIRQGRGLGNTGLKRDVDYTILSLSEFKRIVEERHSLEVTGKNI